MTLRDLLETLDKRGVQLSLEGERLRFRAPAGALTLDLREHIGSHRPAIIEELRRRKENGKPNQTKKCVKCDRRFWVDAPPEDDWIRTHCSRCGTFIGYRPAK